MRQTAMQGQPQSGCMYGDERTGATNLVTGIGTAYMDLVPMVAITCNVANPLLGKDSFQEVDIAVLRCRLRNIVLLSRISMSWQTLCGVPLRLRRQVVQGRFSWM